jgi:hypothetical protein
LTAFRPFRMGADGTARADPEPKPRSAPTGRGFFVYPQVPFNACLTAASGLAYRGVLPCRGTVAGRGV